MPVRVLDPHAALPLYHQLADLLRRSVLTGQVPVGGKLPSESQLVSDYGVSRVTARQAVGVLVEEGLVERGSGRGTRVLPQPPTPAGQQFSGSLSDLIKETQRTQAGEVRFERDVTAPPAIAAALELAEPQVDRISRTRHLDGSVFAYTVDHLPPALGRLVTKDALEKDSLMGFLLQSGVEMNFAKQSIQAEVADLDMAARLGLRPGDPILAVSRTVFDSWKRPIFYVQSYYRGDRYVYTVELGLNKEDPEAIHGGMA